MKTTAKHLATFKAECERLRKLWGLNDVRIHYLHEHVKDGFAECCARATHNVYWLTLSTQWHDSRKLTDEEIRSTARHEMTHVVLGRLTALARSRYVTEDEVQHAIEATCRQIDGLLPR